MEYLITLFTLPRLHWTDDTTMMPRDLKIHVVDYSLELTQVKLTIFHSSFDVSFIGRESCRCLIPVRSLPLQWDCGICWNDDRKWNG